MHFHFRFFLLVFFVFIHAALSAQRTKKSGQPENFLAGTSWKVDGIPFETEARESYIFSEFDALEYSGRYGYFITFEETAFSSHYSAPCGMDCFTNVQGEYYVESAFQIHIKVNVINRHGLCGKESETINSNYGLYTLERTRTGWNVTKI